ncbi:4Fe-4S dicluster domain-containing protein [Nocardioides sp. YIM 123512]|uniref:4Fe-4S dicluster domain-containing protein n=2 Tax=Nocardioides flavescens TaxID=2691959 RepID=A0A6L7EVF5_9ACTN|nr:heterodisulfide reductase-related iron-sulfur binding cluster [Nocardioides flavescens]MXG89686.1 4Fe-4S dicluster domain-containing protein [Nocardioides flavescens]
MMAVALPLAGKRVFFLYRLISSGKPAPDRIEQARRNIGETTRAQLVEVLGQRKLLKWSVPGVAHAFVFWAFLILGTVYLEAFGILFSRNPEWAIPVVGHWDVLGFAQDMIAVLCLVGLGLFAWIRLRNNPRELGRRSRFSGSHLGGAWLILFMIVNVIWTLFLFRGAAAAEGNLPYGWGAFVSTAIGKLLHPIGADGLEVLEGVGLLLHIGVMLAFLVIVLNSKHLHIFVAPLNVMFKRDPVALGAVKPLMNDGKPVTLDDIDDLDEEATLGVGSIEDFSWKGLLDMASCTECGRCQSQCPAWNTEKPLSPKMLIMNLRDHAFAKAPYILADEAARAGLGTDVLEEAERPLVGETEGLAWEPEGGAIIDTDVLWSCVTCGACVEQCPVDIEHVDHIVDMRRYQVLVESNFPAELNQLFKGMENKGNPWNMSPTARMDWAKGLDFDVKVVGEDVESLDEVEWLFWVGCAGAYEDRQKKTTRAVAELLHMADVEFAVLGNGETCNGDQARRAGNEFVFQGLAQQNVETFKEFKVKKVVSTCAHCFNTLKNEYKEFGVELEVVHHTQLLNRLVREGRLTPVAQGAGAHQRKITYHDPCYIGRHNGVYSPPRELLQVLPGAEYVEMERHSERSFCCGAGGARMWMEENIGERINMNRSNEAIGTGADQIAVGCPFCRVMLSDGLTAAQDSGQARAEVEVLDVAQMLLASVKGEMATRAAPGSLDGSSNGVPASPEARATAPTEGRSVETKAEPEQGDVTLESPENTVVDTAEASPAAKASGGGSSLFDNPFEDASEDPDKPATAAAGASLAEEAQAAKPATSGGSLFDVDDSSTTAADEPAPAAKPAGTSGGSLFDVEDDAPAEPAPAAKPATSGGSLFDVAEDEPTPAAPAAKAEPAAPAAPAAETSLGGGSLFDIAEDEPAPAAPVEPAAPAESSVPDETPELAPAAEVDLSSGGSLFDLEEPADPAPAAPAEASEAAAPTGAQVAAETEAEPADQVQTEQAHEPTSANTTVAEPEQPSTPPSAAPVQASGADFSGSLFDIASPTVESTPAPTPEPEPAPAPVVEEQPATEEPEPAEEPASKPAPKPAASGESHTPKTGVDIDESGSLFDL